MHHRCRDAEEGHLGLESPTLTPWAVRHAERTANLLVKSDVEMVDGSIITVSPYILVGTRRDGRSPEKAPIKCSAPDRTTEDRNPSVCRTRHKPHASRAHRPSNPQRPGSFQGRGAEEECSL